eukprot:1466176-Rhodomonas_salina.1
MTDCICNDGFSGPAGGPCEQSEPGPSAPSRTPNRACELHSLTYTGPSSLHPGDVVSFAYWIRR